MEDNLALAKLLGTHLRQTYVVDHAGDLATSHYLLDIHDYDLLILDLILPDGHGLELCQYLTENKLSLPILFLTVETDIEQKTTCLAVGQADYLTKPFSLAELRSRLRLLLQKTSNSTHFTSVLRAGVIELNSELHQVYLDKKPIMLSRKEFSLLELLLLHPKQILSKATLAEKIWQDEEAIFGNSIETTIASLRRKLGKDSIITIKGVGYRINSR